MFRHIYNYRPDESSMKSRFHRPAMTIRDYGKMPFVVDIEDITKRNTNFRRRFDGEFPAINADEHRRRGKYRLGNASRRRPFSASRKAGVIVMGKAEERLIFRKTSRTTP